MKNKINILIFIICIFYSSSSLNFLNRKKLYYQYSIEEDASNLSSIITLEDKDLIAYIDIPLTTVIIKNIETLKIVKTKKYKQLTDESSICYIKNLNQIVIVFNNQINIWDLSSNENKSFNIDLALKNLICLEKNLVVLYSKDFYQDQVRVLNVLSGKIVNSISNPSQDKIDIVIVDEDEDNLIISTNNKINVYNLYSNKLKSTLKIDNLEIKCLYKSKYLISNKMIIKNYIDGSILSIDHDPKLTIAKCLGNNEFSTFYYNRVINPWDGGSEYYDYYLYNIDSKEKIYLSWSSNYDIIITSSLDEYKYLVKDYNMYKIYEKK